MPSSEVQCWTGKRNTYRIMLHWCIQHLLHGHSICTAYSSESMVAEIYVYWNGWQAFETPWMYWYSMLSLHIWRLTSDLTRFVTFQPFFHNNETAIYEPSGGVRPGTKMEVQVRSLVQSWLFMSYISSKTSNLPKQNYTDTFLNS